MSDNILIYDNFIEMNPDNLWLEFSAQERETSWNQTLFNHYPYKAAQCRAFINNLCLNTFMKWLADEPDLQENCQLPSPSPDLYRRWELVDGIDLNFNQTRIVLIPSEQINTYEFRIPQEWVDIPNWAANYYLAAQLNVEAGWLRIWGFISHQEVLKKAQYDSIDGTYCIPNRDLIADIDVMWVAQKLCTLPQPQVKPLPQLSETQANIIIQKLSKQTFCSPRLDISFPEWAAILSSDKYRQALYDRNIEDTQVNIMKNTQNSVRNLSLWFEDIFSEGWQSIDDLLHFTDTKKFHFRSDSVLNEVCVKGAKLIDLGMQLESESLALLIGLSPQVDEKIGIRVQLYPSSGETYLPESVQLTLLSESGTTLQYTQSRNYDNYIQLKRFKLPLGKYFSIQVTLNDAKIKENFVLEGFAHYEI